MNMLVSMKPRPSLSVVVPARAIRDVVVRDELEVRTQQPTRSNSVTSTEADDVSARSGLHQPERCCVVLLVVGVPCANAPRTSLIAKTNAPRGTGIGTIVCVRRGDTSLTEVVVSAHQA